MTPDEHTPARHPTDPLQRFIDAQARVYERVRGELAAGRKRSHWMWYIFPQLAGLGTSDMAQRYAIQSLDEARAYDAHPLLGARLRECFRLVVDSQRLAADIFPYPDDLKFRSCATLFNHVAPEVSIYRQAIVGPCQGVRDGRTVRLMGAGGVAGE